MRRQLRVFTPQFNILRPEFKSRSILLSAYLISEFRIESIVNYYLTDKRNRLEENSKDRKINMTAPRKSVVGWGIDELQGEGGYALQKSRR